MTEKELDKLFSSKLQDREFEMNPDNWAAMEQILDAKATRGGAFYWRAVAVILAFGLLAGSSLLWRTPDTPARNISNQVQQEPVETKAPESPIRQSPSTERADDIQGSGHSTPPVGSGPEELITTNAEPAPKTNTAEATGENGGLPAEPVTEARDQLQTMDPRSEMTPITWSARNLRGIQQPPLSLSLSIADNFIAYNPQHEIFVTAASLAGNSFGSTVPGVGYSVAVGYSHQLAPAFSLETSAKYLHLRNVNIRNQHDSTFYNFGREHIETRSEITQLQYLQVPVRLRYQLSPQHSISLGGYAGMLLSVTENLERRHEMPKRLVNQQESTITGYQEDFRRFDFGLTAAYFYRITPDLSLGLELQHGLTDITRNVSEGFKPAHHNFNTQLSLRYRFMRL